MMKSVWNWFVKKLQSGLYGDDIFISYSREDAATYAAGLANELVKLGFACRFDQWGTNPSDELPEQLKRALRSSSMFVIIGSYGAAKSLAVKQEIQEFLKTDRLIVPIDLDGSTTHAPWWQLLQGLFVTVESTQDSTKAREPSAEVINQIEKSFTFKRRDQRLRITSTVVACLTVLLILTSVVAGVVAAGKIEQAKLADKQAEIAEKNAAEQRRLAYIARGEANKQSQRAAEQTRIADAATQNATQQSKRAITATQRAAEQTRIADAATREAKKERESARIATGFRQNAEAEATKTMMIARSRSALTAGYPLLASQLAKQSLNIRDSTEARILLAEAYNQGLPREFHSWSQIDDIAINPLNTRQFAVIGFPIRETQDTSTKLRKNELALRCSQPERWYRRQDAAYYAAVFSNDGRSIYAVALTKYSQGPGEPDRQKITSELSVIQFDLKLRELRRKRISPFLQQGLPNQNSLQGTSSEWDVRGVVELRMDRTGKRLVMAGYAARAFWRNISNPKPHHFTAWIDVSSWDANHDIDQENELSAFHTYRGRVVLLGHDKQVIIEGTSGLKMLNMQTGRSEALGQHVTNVVNVDASDSGLTVAAVGDDNRVSVWQLIDNTWKHKEYQMNGISGGAAIRFVNDNQIAVARQDFSVSLLSMSKDADGFSEKFTREVTFAGHTGQIRDLTVSPDGQWIATASDDKTVRVWSIRQDNRRFFVGSERPVVSVIFSSSSSLLTAGMDGKVREWNIHSSQRFSLPIVSDPSRSEVRVSDEDWDEGGGLDRTINLMNLGFVNSFRWSADRRTLIATTYDKHWTQWDRNYRRVRAGNGEPAGPPLVAPKRMWHGGYADLPVSPTNLLTNKGGLMWPEIINNSTLRLHPVHGHRVPECYAQGIFSPNRKWFVQFDAEGECIRIWNLRSRRAQPIELKIVYGSLYHNQYGDPASHSMCKFSPNEDTLAFPFKLRDKEAMVVLDLPEGRPHCFSADISVQAFDVNDHGDLLVGGRTGDIYLNSSRGFTTRVLQKHSRYVTSVAFSPDGQWIASGSRDRTVRLWARNGRGYLEFALLNPVESVLFSASGQEVLAASGQGIHSWYVPSHPPTDWPQLAWTDLKGLPVDIAPSKKRGLTTPKKAMLSPYSKLAFLTCNPKDTSQADCIERALGRPIQLNRARRHILMSILEQPTAKVSDRIWAALELSASGRECLPFLSRACAIFAQDDKQLNQAIVELLRAMGPDAQVGVLAEFRRQQSSSVRRNMSIAIAELYPKIRAAENELISQLRISLQRHHSDDKENFVIAFSLARLSTHEMALPLLVRAMSKDSDVAEEAAKLVPRYGLQAVPLLIEVLTQKNAEIGSPSPWSFASESLKAIGKPAVPYLITAMNKETGKARTNIIRALGQFGNDATASIDDLILLLHDQRTSSRDVMDWRNAALQTLGAIGPEARRAIPAIVDALIKCEHCEYSAANALARMGSGAAPILVAKSRGINGSARRRIFNTLGKLGAEATVGMPLLIEGLSSQDFHTVQTATKALEAIGPTAAEAVPVLVRMLDTGNSQESVLRALAKIAERPDIVVPAVIKLIAIKNEAFSNGSYTDHRQHAVSIKTLISLAREDVPDDVLNVLAALLDKGTQSDLELRTLLSTRVGDEALRRYGTRIFDITQLEIGDDYSLTVASNPIYRQAALTLSVFKHDASPALPLLMRTKKQFASNADVQRAMDMAIQAIEPFGPS